MTLLDDTQRRIMERRDLDPAERVRRAIAELRTAVGLLADQERWEERRELLGRMSQLESIARRLEENAP